MCLRRAVLQIPAKSSVPPRLPFYKICSLLTHSESTRLHVLIPLHFNSPRISTYKKPGRGSLLPAPKFCNSSLPTCHPICSHSKARNLHPLSSSPLPFNLKLSIVNCPPLTRFPVALTATSQRTENTSTLILGPANVDAASSISPLLATLTENTGGGVPPKSPVSSSALISQLVRFSAGSFRYLITSCFVACFCSATMPSASRSHHA